MYYLSMIALGLLLGVITKINGIAVTDPLWWFIAIPVAVLGSVILSALTRKNKG